MLQGYVFPKEIDSKSAPNIPEVNFVRLRSDRKMATYPVMVNSLLPNHITKAVSSQANLHQEDSRFRGHKPQDARGRPSTPTPSCPASSSAGVRTPPPSGATASRPPCRGPGSCLHRCPPTGIRWRQIPAFYTLSFPRVSSFIGLVGTGSIIIRYLPIVSPAIIISPVVGRVPVIRI